MFFAVAKAEKAHLCVFPCTGRSWQLLGAPWKEGAEPRIRPYSHGPLQSYPHVHCLGSCRFQHAELGGHTSRPTMAAPKGRHDPEGLSRVSEAPDVPGQGPISWCLGTRACCWCCPVGSVHCDCTLPGQKLPCELTVQMRSCWEVSPKATQLLWVGCLPACWPLPPPSGGQAHVEMESHSVGWSCASA